LDKTTPSFQHWNSEPVDALLAAYCAGSLEPALHALVASHLALNPVNRSFVAALEELAAGRFNDGEAAPLAADPIRLEAILSAEQQTPGEEPPPPDPIFPAPLQRYLGARFEGVRWRRLLPGVREHRIERSGRGASSLLWIKRGRGVPSHTHEGSEVTLVLKGAFTDATGRYRRGDLVIADADLDHRPIGEGDEDCICFTVADAPLRLTGPLGRVIDRFFRR
jgi:putative transcriptional regulator